MKPSEHIKPISYLKAHTSELINNISKNKSTVVITQNGEAKVIVQDVKEYEQLQDSIALLKILAMSSKSIKEARTKTAKKAFSDIRKHIETDSV
ncbi:MAG: type II toxin-antitoxin system Phd/YefM family antitoxin [Candidatus Dadabacteria bacterium]|nr:type II toxin-antitoxin system Phd/YefM family antitoxin [Candidatus Dadabacteria bacterium]